MGYNAPKQTVSQFQLKGRYARQYLSFAGKSSKDFLLYLSGPGVYDSPAADVESTSVPGRNGDIITENARTGRRRYQNVDIKYKAFFFNGLPAKTAAVKAWLLSPIGYQKLQDTYDPDFFRMAVCKDALEFDVTAQKAAEMELTFNCKPQRWSVYGQRVIRLDGRSTLKNPFAFPAQPIFKIYGDSGGELYVGEEKITIHSIKDYVLLNCETHNAYNASGFCNETIIDRVTWDKVQTMLFEKPRADMTKGPGKKKVKSIKGSPFGNLRCGAILENGPDAGKPCGEGFFRTTYTGVANGYSDERSLKATGEDTGEYLEKYTYSYPVWRCKRKVGERDGEPPKTGSPDQKAYCRSKKGCMSDEEKEAANKRCPSERYHECALEQSFMELLYSMKRDFEQHGDASMIVTMFDNAYEQAVRLANNNSISVQRMATVENQIKEMEERLQDAISHQVAALREAALEQNVELNEALSNGEVTIDDIDLDIRSGLTPGSIGVSFYGTETEEGSEAQIYTELVNDLQERLKVLQQERQTIEEEQGVLAIMKKNFEYFLACLKELPDTNAGGMPLRVNGLDVQGSLLRDVDGKPIEGRVSAVTKGKLKLTPERIAEAPDMLHFEKGIYCAFAESGVLQGDVATYKTNFGVTLTSKGNRRTLDSFMGYKRSDMDGNVVYVDAPYKVYGFSIQYRRYLTTAAKREREEAV